MRRFADRRWVAALLVGILTAIVLFNDLGTFHTDIKPEVYVAPWEVLGRYLSSWTDSPYLGSPNFNVGLVPVLAVLSALRGIGLSPEFAFKVFHLAIWLVAAFGANRLARALAPQLGWWGGMLAAVLYLANPYTVSAGATLAVALPLAFLPWQLWFFLRALRNPASWVWPALFGLTFFAMSGMNVAVIPLYQLLALIPVILFARATAPLAVRDVVRTLVRCAIIVVGVSLYWLIPAVAALGTGSQIVQNSESLTGIAKVSSFSEVLRGVGLWPLYGKGSFGPWIPGHAVYVAMPMVIILTMAWPALALGSVKFAARPVRRFIAAAALIAAIVMVGIFPGEENPASWFGVVLREILQNPLGSMFRTTNKVGAVLALALALGAAITLVALVPWLWRFVMLRISIVVVSFALIAGWSLPAWTGSLYTSPMEIPDYWTQAAEDINAGDEGSAVLVLPGQTRPHSRWTVDRPDDVVSSVLTRRAVLPETTPNASPVGVNFLAAVNEAVQTASGAPDIISTLAHYLGASQVLMRHDVVWENAGGARPASNAKVVADDPGLFGRANYGAEGQFTLAPGPDPFAYDEHLLPPLQLYDVRSPTRLLRATPLTNGVVVAGDGFAFSAMTGADILKDRPLVRYAHGLDQEGLLESLSAASRFVITDTNARRDVIANRLDAGQGPLLTAKQELGESRTLGDDPADQTVMVPESVRVTTSMAGGAFFDMPYGAGEFAVDGSGETGWRFGDFRTAVGATIRLDFDEPLTLGSVPVQQLKIGSTLIDEVTLTAGGQTRTISLPDDGWENADFEGVEATSLTLRVDSLRGEGFNIVGIAEIGLPGVTAKRFARTPLTFSRLLAEASDSARGAFAQRPLDVLLTRVINGPGPADDSESRLDRLVTLPDERSFEIEADVRVRGSTDVILDRLDGWSTRTQFTSSGNYFDRPEVRASRAADGADSTGWIPGGGTRGAWWQSEGPERAIAAVTLSQARTTLISGDEHHRVTRVEIEVDGEPVATADVSYGQNRIALPAGTRGERVRITAVGLAGDPDTLPPTFSEIDTGVELSAAGAGDEQCLPVATIDGEDVLMRPATDSLANSNAAGTRWTACSDVALGEGEHRIEQSGGFVIDSFNLLDVDNRNAIFNAGPKVEVLEDGRTSKTVRVSGGTGGYAVSIGQSHNENWTATADGKDLGVPVVLDGFSTGWVMPDGQPRTIEIRYAPQRWAWVAIGISGVVLLMLLGVVGRAVYLRRRAAAELVGGRVDPTSVPVEDDEIVGRRTAPESLTRYVSEPTAGQRLGIEIGLVGAGFFFVGWGGLAAVAAMIGLARWRPQSRGIVAAAGAALLLVSAVVYVVLAGSERGTVSADVVSASLWPHHLAGAGLVLAALAVFVPDRWVKPEPEHGETATETDGGTDVTDGPAGDSPEEDPHGSAPDAHR